MSTPSTVAKSKTPKARRKRRPESFAVIGGVKVKLMPLHPKGTLPMARLRKAIDEMVALRSTAKSGHAKRS